MPKDIHAYPVSPWTLSSPYLPQNARLSGRDSFNQTNRNHLSKLTKYLTSFRLSALQITTTATATKKNHDDDDDVNDDGGDNDVDYDSDDDADNADAECDW